MGRVISSKDLKTLVDYMNNKGLDGVFLYDSEAHRDPNIAYLSGHPMDCSLIVAKSGKLYLNPWDKILATKLSDAEYIYSMAEKNLYDMIKFFIENENISGKAKIEIAPNSSVGMKKRIESYTETELVFFDTDSFFTRLSDIRTIKNDKEIKIIREAADIQNQLIEEIYPFVSQKKDIKEYELEMHLIMKAKELGAEKESFEFLTANSDRSWGIHAFPATSNAPLNKRGLALIDFGILYKGYCTDVTIPMGFGPLNDEEKKIAEIVKEAHDKAIDSIELGKPTHEISKVAVDIIEKNGYKMPHSLGHGVGIEVHEFPRVAQKPTDERMLKFWKEEKVQKGMYFTIEPGIYKEGLGGSRLEDDILITDNGIEKITKSRFYHFKENYI